MKKVTEDLTILNSVDLREIRDVEKISVGDRILIGSVYSMKTWQITTITKIDKRQVVTTDSGHRFSGKSGLLSTKKVSDRWLQIFDLQKTFDHASKRQERWEKEDKVNKHNQLKLMIGKLDPEQDEKLIQRLTKLLDQE